MKRKICMGVLVLAIIFMVFKLKKKNRCKTILNLLSFL